MALLVKSNGTAEATTDEKQQQTTASAAATQATGTQKSGSSGTQKSTDAAQETTQTTGVPEAAAEGVTNTNKGTDFSKVQLSYDGKYDEQLADLYNQIINRKPFEYSTEDDQLYQQYMDRYIKGGRLAMQDTMGQAAALTGGYGNSYAQRVGQQTYDEYMTGLNDKALELEQTAYGRWQDQGTALQQQYAMLNQLADDDYAKWGDAYDRALAEAGLRANSGDFEPYKQLYGDEAGNQMAFNYAIQVYLPMYKNGQIDAETYKQLTGDYPPGYNAGGGGGGIDWTYNPGTGKPETADDGKKEYGEGIDRRGMSMLMANPNLVNNEVLSRMDQQQYETFAKAVLK